MKIIYVCFFFPCDIFLLLLGYVNIKWEESFGIGVDAHIVQGEIL